MFPFFSLYQYPFFDITGPLTIYPATYEAKMPLDHDVSQARTFDTRAHNHFTPASPQSHTPSLVLLHDISACLFPNHPSFSAASAPLPISLPCRIPFPCYPLTITVKLSVGFWGQDVSFFSLYQYPFFDITGL